MNIISSIEPKTLLDNSTTTTIESWFILIGVVRIVCTTLVILLTTVFLFIIVLDKTCHTIPMMLFANSFLAALTFGCSLLGLNMSTLINDLTQIQYEDSCCVFRAYIAYVSGAVMNYSFLLPAVYRYIIVVYPTRFFWQTLRFQVLLICLTWIFSLIYPFAYTFNNEIIYNIDNQLCQLHLQFSFSVIYTAFCSYLMPVSMTMLIYFKLVRYVKEMSKIVTPVNILYRAQRELKMVQQTVVLVTILVTLGIPYASFIFISFYTAPPKYHFRIAYLFMDVSLVTVTIASFKFTEPLITSVMKIINR